MSREEIISQNPIADFVRSRGHELKSAGENFVTNGCPVKQHKKYHRPNTIDTAKNLWHCNDCGGGGTVIDWLAKEKRISVADAMRELGGSGEIVRAYDYTDERGKLLFQCVRYEPKDFKQRRPDGNGGWIWNVQGVRRVLYRLPEAIKAQLVCITEGEKNADDLVKLGFVATTNPFGALQWCDDYNESLRGKDVVVFGDVGDADKKGEKHTEKVIASLLSSGIAARHALQPDGFHDVSDYIASLPANTAAQEIAKLIDEAKFAPTPRVEAQPRNDEPVELPPPPRPYVSPPLNLLPSQLQDYVLEAAESLNKVDLSFILLPLLSAIAAGIGNSRSILLKRGYIEPPIIWSAVIAEIGRRKTPAIEKGTIGVERRERQLQRENKQAREIYAEDLAAWESASKPSHGKRPREPISLTCKVDDLTIETLADRLVENPRGILVAREELSGWVASFDQYRSGVKGADITRWLSLHTGMPFSFDRRSDRRMYRINLPRVSLTGTVQPETLQRVLTQDFFDRGLPARILFAHPPFKERETKWTNAEVDERIEIAVFELFDDLWSLQPDKDDYNDPCPQLLRLDPEAQVRFIEHFNQCGRTIWDSQGREAAAWSKMIGYAARFALIGQLTRHPQSEITTGDTMAAACDLADWFGREAVRIYAALAETPEQQELRELIEFLQSRGGSASIREGMTFHRPLRDKREKAERLYNALVRAKYGEWIETRGERGPATRKIQLLLLSASAGFPVSPKVAPKPADADAHSSGKKEAPSGPDTEAETLVGDSSGVARL